MKVERHKAATDCLKILKETDLNIHHKVKIKGDLGYQGIDEIHPHGKIHYTKSNNIKITKKQNNRKNIIKKVNTILDPNRIFKYFGMMKEMFHNLLKEITKVWQFVFGLANQNLSINKFYLKKLS